MKNNRLYMDVSGPMGTYSADFYPPVFVMSSLRLNDEDAQNAVIGFGQHPNILEFKSIRVQPQLWHGLEHMLNHPSLSTNSVALALYHKEYFMAGHLVDKLIIPLLEYKEKQTTINKEALLHLVFHCMPMFCEKKRYGSFRLAFLEMFRLRNANSIEKFYEKAQAMLNSCGDEGYALIIKCILDSNKCITDILNMTDRYGMEVCFTGLIALMNKWSYDTSTKYEIVVDGNKKLDHLKGMADTLSSTYGDKPIPYLDHPVKLPLPIQGIVFDDLNEYVQTRIVDVLAGALCYYGSCLIGHGQKDELFQIIAKSKLMDYVYSSIWPEQAQKAERSEKKGCDDDNTMDSLVYLFS